MKKLLALILCVMMFVSVIPTMAFATEGDKYDTSKVDPIPADPTGKDDLKSASDYKKQVEKMIENTKKNVATAYGVLAMDQVVYSSAKSMDDVIVGLVDQIADQISGKTINGTKYTAEKLDEFKTNSKKSVRAVIQDLVIKEIGDNESKYKDKDGKIDPVKYGQVVAGAVNKALNDKDFQAGYQAVATYFALANVADSINDELKKQRDAFKDSIDTSFDEDFTGYYEKLVADYVDTLKELDGGEFDADNFPWTAYVTPEVGKQS